MCEDNERSYATAGDAVEHTRRDERSEMPRRVQPSPDRRIEKISKKVDFDQFLLTNLTYSV